MQDKSETWYLPSLLVTGNSCCLIAQSCWLFATLWTAAHQASLSFTVSQGLLKLMSLCQWCHPTISSSVVPLFFLPSIFASIRVFSNELAFCIRWPKNWSFTFSISPSNAYSGLISFRIDWFDFLAVQGTLESLLQHHNLKALILWHSVFFMVQLSYPYVGLLEKP